MFSAMFASWTGRRFYAAARKRFYKNVSVVSDYQGARSSYEICLDGKKVKTQGGNAFKLPSEALALAIAQEWDAQKKTLRMDHMRLTGLAFTAIDNPLRLDTPTIIKQIIDYLETDTVFFMASEPDKLVELQKLHWGELLKWSNETFGLDVRPTESILAGPVISEQSRLMMERHLASYDRWALTGYQYAVEAVKSLIIILATVAHRLSVEEAVRIAALEQLFQTETWGKVEWAHDIEHHDLCSRVAAGVLFVHLTSNRESTTKTIARA